MKMLRITKGVTSDLFIYLFIHTHSHITDLIDCFDKLQWVL